ncbi:hypothetical protein FHG87_001233 [Trinorchestia longiramus]|nr:hypothetical protein FHG87_001233 [Trinorchestia longiramus]
MCLQHPRAGISELASHLQSRQPRAGNPEQATQSRHLSIFRADIAEQLQQSSTPAWDTFVQNFEKLIENYFLLNTLTPKWLVQRGKQIHEICNIMNMEGTH